MKPASFLPGRHKVWISQFVCRFTPVQFGKLRVALSSVRRTTKIKLEHFVLCRFSREGENFALHCDESAIRLPPASEE